MLFEIELVTGGFSSSIGNDNKEKLNSLSMSIAVLNSKINVHRIEVKVDQRNNEVVDPKNSRALYFCNRVTTNSKRKSNIKFGEQSFTNFKRHTKIVPATN